MKSSWVVGCFVAVAVAAAAFVGVFAFAVAAAPVDKHTYLKRGHILQHTSLKPDTNAIHQTHPIRNHPFSAFS